LCILKEVQGSTEDDPFDAIFVTFAEGLPYSLFFRGLACDAYSSSSTVRSRRILLDFTKLDAFRGDVMPSISKIKETPKCSIWIGLGDLEKGKIGGIGRR
jgi:hypothetical protein